MAIAIAIPILSILLILQSAVFSRIVLLQGTANLVLLALVAWALQKQVKTAWHWCIIGGLLVSYVSAVPLAAPLLGYVMAVGVALLLKQRVWQAPLLAMFVTTFMGTIVVQLVELAALRITGVVIPFFQSINLVTLPSIMLNLLLAIPFYAIFRDLSNWLYPEELVV
jgi:cell shape-determining protein MreD